MPSRTYNAMAAGKFVNEGRRALLAKIGSAALALPFLPELDRSAWAQGTPPGGKVAKNFIGRRELRRDLAPARAPIRWRSARRLV